MFLKIKNGKKINLKIFFGLKDIFDLQLKHINYIVEKFCFNKQNTWGRVLTPLPTMT